MAELPSNRSRNRITRLVGRLRRRLEKRGDKFEKTWRVFQNLLRAWTAQAKVDSNLGGEENDGLATIGESGESHSQQSPEETNLETKNTVAEDVTKRGNEVGSAPAASVENKGVDIAGLESVCRLLNNIRLDPNGNQDDEQSLCDHIWGKLQDMMCVPEQLRTSRCVKADLDAMVEEFFGTMDSPDAPNQDLWTSATVFSLYLARKCLIVNRRENLEKSRKKMIDLVTSGRPEGVDPVRENRSKAFMSKLVRALFTVRSRDSFLKNKQAQVPTQSAACVEGKIKRNLFYGLSKAEGKPWVIPKAILSGGKIRVITLDSYENMTYARFNAYMFGRIRRQKWAIAGRSVQEWWDNQGGRLNDYSDVCSGDLQSATDTFNGALADICIEHVARLFGLSEGECEEMKSFTTRSSLKVADGDFRQQTRGQLMGSCLSFPILCLVSLTAWAVGTDFDIKTEKKQNNELLRALAKEPLGINGDDIVFGTEDGGAGWQRGVASIWGIVSPGKSLLSKWAFTVNSELWWREQPHWGEEFEHVGILRPSLLIGITDGRTAFAEESWEEYARSPLFESAALRKLIEKRLKTHLPPSMGGLGTSCRFVLDDVKEWWKNQKAGKVVVRPSAWWDEDKIQNLAEDKRTSCRYLVPNDKVEEVMKAIREPYVGLPEWTETGVQLADMDMPSDSVLRSLFEREVWKFREGLTALTVPSRVTSILDDWRLKPIKMDEDNKEDLSEFILQERLKRKKMEINYEKKRLPAWRTLLKRFWRSEAEKKLGLQVRQELAQMHASVRNGAEE